MIFLYITAFAVIAWGGWRAGKWFYDYLSNFDNFDDRWGL